MKRFNLSVFAMNVVDVWLSYQGIIETKEPQSDFHNCCVEEMIDNTYDRFMMQSAEGRRRNIVDYDDKTFDDDNILFIQINGAPRCGISLHVTPNKNRREKCMGEKLNTCFKASARSARRIRHVCVWIVWTPSLQP